MIVQNKRLRPGFQSVWNSDFTGRAVIHSAALHGVTVGWGGGLPGWRPVLSFMRSCLSVTCSSVTQASDPRAASLSWAFAVPWQRWRQTRARLKTAVGSGVIAVAGAHRGPAPGDGPCWTPPLLTGPNAFGPARKGAGHGVGCGGRWGPWERNRPLCPRNCL